MHTVCIQQQHRMAAYGPRIACSSSGSSQHRQVPTEQPASIESSFCPPYLLLPGKLVSQLGNMRTRADVEQMITGQVRPGPFYEDTYRSEDERVVSIAACQRHNVT